MIFTRASRDPAHSDGCGHLSQKGLTPLGQNSDSNKRNNGLTLYEDENQTTYILSKPKLFQLTCCKLYAFFWVIPRRLNFICRRFGTLSVPSSKAGWYKAHFIPTCLCRWNRQCSETSVYKIQTPGNYPEESTQHSEHGESLL